MGNNFRPHRALNSENANNRKLAFLEHVRGTEFKRRIMKKIGEFQAKYLSPNFTGGGCVTRQRNKSRKPKIPRSG